MFVNADMFTVNRAHLPFIQKVKKKPNPLKYNKKTREKRIMKINNKHKGNHIKVGHLEEETCLLTINVSLGTLTAPSSSHRLFF